MLGGGRVDKEKRTRRPAKVCCQQRGISSLSGLSDNWPGGVQFQRLGVTPSVQPFTNTAVRPLPSGLLEDLDGQDEKTDGTATGRVSEQDSPVSSASTAGRTPGPPGPPSAVCEASRGGARGEIASRPCAPALSEIFVGI